MKTQQMKCLCPALTWAVPVGRCAAALNRVREKGGQAATFGVYAGESRVVFGVGHKAGVRRVSGQHLSWHQRRGRPARLYSRLHGQNVFSFNPKLYYKNTYIHRLIDRWID